LEKGQKKLAAVGSSNNMVYGTKIPYGMVLHYFWGTLRHLGLRSCRFVVVVLPVI